MKIKEKLLIMFFVGFGLTFIEMITLYWSLDKPAIVSILLFLAFSMFNGFIYTEAIDKEKIK
jgi:uncharacterized membrane protein